MDGATLSIGFLLLVKQVRLRVLDGLLLFVFTFSTFSALKLSG